MQIVKSIPHLGRSHNLSFNNISLGTELQDSEHGLNVHFHGLWNGVNIFLLLLLRACNLGCISSCLTPLLNNANRADLEQKFWNHTIIYLSLLFFCFVIFCRSENRNLVYCLRFCKPQENLSVHLTQVCMKQSTPEERAEELQKAKDSSRDWIRASRTWDYKRLCEILPHSPCRLVLVEEFWKRGFLLTNLPKESDPPVESQDDATASTSQAPTACPFAATAPPTSPDKDSPSSTGASSPDEAPCTSQT